MRTLTKIVKSYDGLMATLWNFVRYYDNLNGNLMTSQYMSEEEEFCWRNCFVIRCDVDDEVNNKLLTSD
jgi:hypothetical protein